MNRYASISTYIYIYIYYMDIYICIFSHTLGGPTAYLQLHRVPAAPPRTRGPDAYCGRTAYRCPPRDSVPTEYK